MKKIFVSSTFRDMQAERDAIQTIVLPLLRREARDYGEDVEICDLRWGVNTGDMDSESGAQKVLSVCLNEIDKSKPFMLIMLGERYGWIPDQSLIKRTADRKHYEIDELEKSVTALEIEYGALADPSVLERSVFMFREPMPQAGAEFQSESEFHAQKLERLKDRIRKIAGNRVFSYSLTWDAWQGCPAGVENFANIVTEQLREQLKHEWATEADLTGLQREERRHWSTVYGKAKQFSGRMRLLDKYKEILSAKDVMKPLLLRGTAGSGKSTLLCKISADCREQGWNVYPFICGNSEISSSALDILRQWVYYVEELTGLPHFEDQGKENGENAEGEGLLSSGKTKYEWRRRFKEVLDFYCAGDENPPLLLAADGLDQLLQDEDASSLCFLPVVPDQKVRVILSCLSDYAVQQRKVFVREVASLQPEEREEVVHGILSKQGKGLDQQVIQEILGKDGANNPLYLSLLLQRLLIMDQDDFKVIAAYGNDMNAINRYQVELIQSAPEDIGGVFRLLVQEVEERIRPDLVHRVLEYLAVSLHGLREQDLQALLAEEGIEWSSLDFSRMLHYMPDLLGEGRNGQIDFKHRIFREQLREHLLEKGRKNVPEFKQKMREYLTVNGYDMSRLDLSKWLSDETSWKNWSPYGSMLYGKPRSMEFVQEERDRDYERFISGRKLLEGVDTAITLLRIQKYLQNCPVKDELRQQELLWYHFYLLDMEGIVRHISETMEEADDFIAKRMAGKMRRFLLEVFYQPVGYEIVMYQPVKCVLSQMERFILGDGEPVRYQREVKKFRVFLDMLYAAFTGNSQKELLVMEGIYPQIAELFAGLMRAMVVIFRTINQENREAIQGHLLWQSRAGEIYRVRGNLEDALDAFKKILPVCKRQFDVEGWGIYGTLCSKIGAVYCEREEWAEAAKMLEQALQIARERYEMKKDGQSTSVYCECLNDMGDMYRKTGMFEKAQKLYEEALTLSGYLYEEQRFMDIAKGYCRSCSNAGKIDVIHKNLQAALKKYEKVSKIRKEEYELLEDLDWEREYGCSCKEIGAVFEMQGREEEALHKYLEAWEVDSKISEYQGTWSSEKECALDCFKLGDLYQKRGERDEALRWYIVGRRKLADWKQHMDMPESLRAYDRQCHIFGEITLEEGKVTETLEIYRDGLQVWEKFFHENSFDERQAIEGAEKCAYYCEKLGEIYEQQDRKQQAQEVWEKYRCFCSGLYQTNHDTEIMRRLILCAVKLASWQTYSGNEAFIPDLAWQGEQLEKRAQDIQHYMAKDVDPAEFVVFWGKESNVFHKLQGYLFTSDGIYVDKKTAGHTVHLKDIQRIFPFRYEEIKKVEFGEYALPKCITCHMKYGGVRFLYTGEYTQFFGTLLSLIVSQKK